MVNNRNAGILCHISSLSGKYGIGNLGKEAYRFAKLLAKSGVTYWQILPLVQTGFGDSPYQSVFCHSGNPYFIDLEALCRQKLLTKEELKAAQHEPGKVDYGALYAERYETLRKAYSRFFFDSPAFRAFVKSGIFEDYALFMTAKTVYGGSFTDWEDKIKFRDPEALEQLRTDYHEEYLFWEFLQYEFQLQWTELKKYCNGLGIRIIGDIPLYVAADSADVWAHPELFQLDKDLRVKKVAGVPPDYFSETGQLWGNPVFDWEAHERESFRWWKERLHRALTTYDVIRIDHFRGIDRYYEVDAGAKTAQFGEWKKGPGEQLFAGLQGRENIIAEDLGIIDEGVRILLRKTGFPGMKVLLFAFDGDPENTFLPHNIEQNCVCYTGTHDNNTVVGYCKSLSSEEFILLRSRIATEFDRIGCGIRLEHTPEKIARTFIEMALFSSANLAVISIQDILGYDAGARMNLPGQSGGNWTFRLEKVPSGKAFHFLKRKIKKYKR